MEKVLIEVNDFKGGMTLNEKLGKKDQFFFGYGLDFISHKGKITVRPDWKRMELSSSVDIGIDLASALFTAKDGNMYFGGEDAKIYKQTSSGTIAVDRTSGQTGIMRSLKEYKGYMYYPQNTTIGRSDLAGTPTYTDNWQTGLENVTYHQQEISANNKLYIGNGRYLASWDGTTWAANALDLQEGWEIRPLANFGIPFIAIGANYKTSSGVSTACKIFLWNRRDSSWNDEIDIPETEIKAMLFQSGYLWIWAGKTCNLYVCPLNSRTPTLMKEFINESPTSGGFEVYPNSVKYRNGRVYFGLSNVNSASATYNPSAIYSFPLNPSQFNLNIERHGGTNVKYKSLAASNYAAQSNDMLYAQETSGTTEYLLRETLSSGEAPYANLQGDHVLETFRYEAPAHKKLYVEGFGVDTDPLPDGTTLDLQYKVDAGNWTTVKSGYGALNEIGFFEEKAVEGKSLKMRLTLYGAISGTARPLVKRIFATGHLNDDPR